MIFRVTLKSPDGVYEGLAEAARESLALIPGITPVEAEFLQEHRHESLYEFCSKWIEGGEYLTVEFDTEKKTATVIEN